MKFIHICFNRLPTKKYTCQKKQKGQVLILYLMFCAGKFTPPQKMGDGFMFWGSFWGSRRNFEKSHNTTLFLRWTNWGRIVRVRQVRRLTGTMDMQPCWGGRLRCRPFRRLAPNLWLICPWCRCTIIFHLARLRIAPTANSRRWRRNCLTLLQRGIRYRIRRAGIPYAL